jgi:hypothetical protein
VNIRSHSKYTKNSLAERDNANKHVCGDNKQKIRYLVRGLPSISCWLNQAIKGREKAESSLSSLCTQAVTSKTNPRALDLNPIQGPPLTFFLLRPRLSMGGRGVTFFTCINEQSFPWIFKHLSGRLSIFVPRTSTG